jgi:hypothetical protein
VIDRSFLTSSLPPPFLADTLRLLHKVYPESYASALRDAYPRQHLATKSGMDRFFRLERDWPLLAKKYGVEVSFQPNANGGWYHVEVGGTDLVLVQKKVSSPYRMVKKRVFWETYLRGNQLDFFGEAAAHEASVVGKRRVFVLLLHGNHKERRDKPAFAHLVIPNRGCTSYLARLDLFKHCYQVATELAGTDVELIKPTVRPVIKRQEGAEGGSA